MNAAARSCGATRTRYADRSKTDVVVDRLEAEAPQLGDAAFELLARRTGWPATTTAIAIAGLERARLAHWQLTAKRAISSATR